MISIKRWLLFYPFKRLIEEYPEEEILVVYDYEFQYDKNFFLCLDPDLKIIINNVNLTIFVSLHARIRYLI